MYIFSFPTNFKIVLPQQFNILLCHLLSVFADHLIQMLNMAQHHWLQSPHCPMYNWLQIESPPSRCSVWPTVLQQEGVDILSGRSRWREGCSVWERRSRTPPESSHRPSGFGLETRGASHIHKAEGKRAANLCKNKIIIRDEGKTKSYLQACNPLKMH